MGQPTHSGERGLRSSGPAVAWRRGPICGDPTAEARISTRSGPRASARFRVAPTAMRQALLRRPRAPANESCKHPLALTSSNTRAAETDIDPAVLDPASVRRALQLIQTTSPHFAIMASIDLARREMVLSGRRLLEQTLERARRAATRLAASPGLHGLRPEHLAGAGTGLHQLDETKLLIGTGGLAAPAHDIVARLNRVHGVQPELSGVGHVLCITTIGNSDNDVDRLVAGFDEAARHFGRRRADAETGLIADLLAVRPATVLTPREAFFAADEAVSLSGAAGRIAAEAITPYPPGIPLVMPGELLSDDVIELLLALRATGNPISASDPTMDRVKVVR